MAETFASALIWPVLLLGWFGWIIPRLLGRVWPEGVRPLLVLAAVSILLLLALGAALFFALYTWRGMPPGALAEAGRGAALLHFLRLGLGSALIWGPVLVLSVASLPARWKHETW